MSLGLEGSANQFVRREEFKIKSEIEALHAMSQKANRQEINTSLADDGSSNWGNASRRPRLLYGRLRRRQRMLARRATCCQEGRRRRSDSAISIAGTRARRRWAVQPPLETEILVPRWPREGGNGGFAGFEGDSGSGGDTSPRSSSPDADRQAFEIDELSEIREVGLPALSWSSRDRRPSTRAMCW